MKYMYFTAFVYSVNIIIRTSKGGIIMLKELRDKIKDIMLGEVKDVIFNSRQGNMTVVEEKLDGDSATNADIQIGQIFVKKLKELLPRFYSY